MKQAEVSRVLIAARELMLDANVSIEALIKFAVADGVTNPRTAYERIFQLRQQQQRNQERFDRIDAALEVTE